MIDLRKSTEDQWPDNTVVDACNGWLYVTTPKVGLALAEASLTVKSKCGHLEDFYFTGFVRESLPWVQLQYLIPGELF